MKPALVAGFLLGEAMSPYKFALSRRLIIAIDDWALFP
jgi:hypothetical protein